MEKPERTELTYITDRIISVTCSAECPEPAYLQSLREILAMLQSKHKHNYMVKHPRTFPPHDKDEMRTLVLFPRLISSSTCRRRTRLSAG